MSDSVTVKILPNDKGIPSGKLADAELHFHAGPLAGLRLLGFAIWQSRVKGSACNVTFPARTYSVNGERRSFALLRPSDSGIDGQERIRALILQAYAEQVEQAAAPAAPSVPAFDPKTAFAVPAAAPAPAREEGPQVPEERYQAEQQNGRTATDTRKFSAQQGSVLDLF